MVMTDHTWCAQVAAETSALFACYIAIHCDRAAFFLLLVSLEKHVLFFRCTFQFIPRLFPHPSETTMYFLTISTDDEKIKVLRMNSS